MSMKVKNLGQEPAFPTEQEIGGVFGTGHRIPVPGMSKRFYAACAAMQGLISGYSGEIEGLDAGWTTKAAFDMADELLKQEEEYNSLK